jgi:hypothetical protein
LPVKRDSPAAYLGLTGSQKGGPPTVASTALA